MPQACQAGLIRQIRRVQAKLESTYRYTSLDIDELISRMADFFAKVLFAKQVARKRKTWQDGFVCVLGQGQIKRSATLYDESGVIISSARVPQSQSLDSDSEGTTDLLTLSSDLCKLLINIVWQASAFSKAGSSMWTVHVTLLSFHMPARVRPPFMPQSQLLLLSQLKAVLKHNSPADRHRSFKYQGLQEAYHHRFASTQQTKWFTTTPQGDQRHSCWHFLSRTARNSATKGRHQLAPSKQQPKDQVHQQHALAAVHACGTNDHSSDADDDILSLLLSPAKLPQPPNPTPLEIKPTNKHRKLQPAHAGALLHQAEATQGQQQQKQPSKWEAFVEEEEVGTMQAAARLSSPTALAATPEKTLTPPPVSSTHDAECSSGPHQSMPGFVSSAQRPAEQELPCSTAATKHADWPQPDLPHNDLRQQPSVHKHPSRAPSVVQAASAVVAQQPLVPVVSKHKHSLFRPPAVLPSHQQASHHRPPLQQANSSTTSRIAGGRPAFEFNVAHLSARHVAIPTSFSNMHAYKQSWTDAVTEEINIRYSTCPSCIHMPGKACSYCPTFF